MNGGDLNVLAAAFTVVGMIGAAFAVSMIFSNSLNAIARNPSAEEKIKKYTFIGAGMVEAMGIFSLVIAILLIFRIGG